MKYFVLFLSFIASMVLVILISILAFEYSTTVGWIYALAIVVFFFAQLIIKANGYDSL